jgi:Tol biopolymer transport system component
MLGGTRSYSVVFVSCAVFALFCFAAGSASADELAYQCDTGVSADVCVINPDNTTSHSDLTETDFDELQPTWAPDAERISFVGDYPGKDGLYVTKTSQPGVATEVLEGGGGYAAWSPDGAWLASERDEGTNELQALVFPSDGTALPHPVGGRNVSEVHSSWSADSKTLAFTHANTVYTAPADGSGEAKPLANGVGNELSWSPNGTWIAAIDPYNEVVRIIAADGSGTATELSVKAALASTIAWSPDSKSVTYIDESDRVWVAPVNSAEGTGHEIPMASGSIVPHEPVFSPEGTRIAFDANPGRSGEMSDQLYIAPSAGGGEAEQLTKGEWNNSEPDWQPIPGGFKPPPTEPQTAGGGETGGAGEKRQPPTIKFASYHHPAVFNEFVTGVYVDCSLGSTNAACQFHGEGSTGASPIGVKPRIFDRPKPKRVVVVKGSIKVPNGKKKELPLKLTAAGRKLLRSGRTLKFKLTITETAPGFKAATTTKTIKVRAPHKR